MMRCEDTNMLTTECACRECRPDLAKIAPAEKVQVSVRFTARFNSPCDICDEWIREGEPMGFGEGDARVCRRHL